MTVPQMLIPALSSTADDGVSTGEDRHAFDKHLNLSVRASLFAALIGCLVVLSFCHPQIAALCEYPAIYDGARLVGTNHLYDPGFNYQEQIRAVGGYSAALSYVRLPFYAMLVWPLGRLPYHASLCVWEVGNAIALGLFIYLWPITSKRFTAIVCGWSLPVMLAFLFAEDDLWLLVILAILFRWRDRRPTAAGIVASMLSIKFHLFLLLPLLLVGQRRWKMARGFLIGCGVLLGVSFVVGSPTWPVDLWHLLSTKAILPREYVMPNVRGLISPFTDRMAPELLVDLFLAAFVFWILRRANFEIGMAATLVGSLLVSHHAGPEDCVVLIPALLALGMHRPRVIPYSLILLSPICYALLSFGGISSTVAVLTIGSILVVLIYGRNSGSLLVPAGQFT